MPSRGPRICQCGLTVAAGTVCICQRRRKAAADRRRPSARQRGYDGEWESARANFLAQPENRFCACGCGRYADVVDHDKPHRGNKDIFWDRSNWKPMAFGCHSAKTAAADGGFGNPFDLVRGTKSKPPGNAVRRTAFRRGNAAPVPR